MTCPWINADRWISFIAFYGRSWLWAELLDKIFTISSRMYTCHHSVQLLYLKFLGCKTCQLMPRRCLTPRLWWAEGCCWLCLLLSSEETILLETVATMGKTDSKRWKRKTKQIILGKIWMICTGHPKLWRISSKKRSFFLTKIRKRVHIVAISITHNERKALICRLRLCFCKAVLHCLSSETYFALPMDWLLLP